MIELGQKVSESRMQTNSTLLTDLDRLRLTRQHNPGVYLADEPHRDDRELIRFHPPHSGRTAAVHHARAVHDQNRVEA